MASLARLACCATNSSTRPNWRQGGSRAHRSHWSRPCACAGRTARLARDRAHVAGTSYRAVTWVTSGGFVENRDLAPRVGPLRSHTPSREVSTLTVIPVLRIADGRCWCTGRRRMAPCRACERVAIVAGASRISRRGLHRRLARFRAGGDASLRGRRSGPGERRRRRSHIARPPCSPLALGCGTGRRGRSPRRFTPRGRSLEA
jgi:hypothetical protein